MTQFDVISTYLQEPSTDRFMPRKFSVFCRPESASRFESFHVKILWIPQIFIDCVEEGAFLKQYSY